MKYGVFFATATALLLSACGYKGGLYLPKEGDTARFGVIQTGLQLQGKPQSAPPTQK
ncbi:TPA: lipoprotein [Neisseria gonorrhoeae]